LLEKAGSCTVRTAPSRRHQRQNWNPSKERNMPKGETKQGKKNKEKLTTKEKQEKKKEKKAKK
jgi:hypothetical protein